MAEVRVAGPQVRARPGRREEVIYYPDSDGKPMAEHDAQYWCITNTCFALERRYAHDPNVYIGANVLIFYQEGDPGKSVAPDVFVVLGVRKGIRRNYLIWEEGKAPDVVFEFASSSPWRADLGWKFGLYEGLGVRECFLFDPLGEYLDPVLQGFRLEGRHYQPIPPLSSGRGILGLASEVLGVELWAREDGGEGMPYVLQLYDPVAEEWLRTPAEEAEARQEAEARVAELKAELARLRGRLERSGD